MQKKSTGMKAFLHSVKRVFRSRNVIIISEHKVDHVPLSGIMQVLLLTGLVGFFSGVSYITGSYMSSSSVIKEKDRKLAKSVMEKGRIAQEIEALKTDLVRLDKNGDALSAYGKFVAHHDANVVSQTMDLSFDSVPLSHNGLTGQSDGKLLDRISFLEHRINEIKNENNNLVAAIRERTNKKIDYLEDIISMTGLDPDHIEHLAKSGNNTSGAQLSAAAHKLPIIDTDDSAAKDANAHKDNQGGPFIPYDNSMALNAQQQAVLDNIDKLILLNGVIGSLPLSQPMANAQESGPFGKRIDPINRRWAMHPGVDLVGPVGSKICATNDGVVIAAGHKPAYGNMVDIEHKFGIVTRYAHMSKILVQPGAKVVRGQAIGVEGSTGRSTGLHLHYEVRINDHPVDPVNFLNAGDYVFQN